MASNLTDYFTQSITFDSPDGPIIVPLADIDESSLYVVQSCVNYGAQIGASIITLLALLLLSKPDKRLSVILIVNTLSLIFSIIRNTLQSVFFSGPFMKLYARFAQDFSQVTANDTAQSVTATVFTLLLQMSVEISLCLQVRVVCAMLHEVHRYVIYTISAIVASMAIGFRFAYMVANNVQTVSRQHVTSLIWLGQATSVMTAISIAWFCLVFVGKLAFALRQRKKLGLGHFGPMQVLIIMGFQTLIIPAVLSICQFWGPAGLSSWALTACAIFLPLSSLWASSSIENHSRPAKSNWHTFSINPSRNSDTSPSGKAQTGLQSPSNTVTTTDTMSKELGSRLYLDDLERQGLKGTGEIVKGRI